MKSIFTAALLLMVCNCFAQPKTNWEQMLKKHLYLGEVFKSGNIYLYSFEDGTKQVFPKTINYYALSSLVKEKATYNKQFSKIKFGKLENNKSGHFSLFDNVSSFIQYKTNPATPIYMHSMVFTLNNFSVKNIDIERGLRTPTEADKRKARMYQEDWRSKYEAAYNEEYMKHVGNHGIQNMLPPTIKKARKLISFTLHDADIKVLISRWMTRSVANRGSICFVVDLLERKKQIGQFEKCFEIGSL